MDDDFKQYRLPDDDNGSWILSTISRIGLDEFTEQESKVTAALDKLKSGKFYDLHDLPVEKREMFIRLSCLYIRSHPEVAFSNDYSRIEKMKTV